MGSLFKDRNGLEPKTTEPLYQDGTDLYITKSFPEKQTNKICIYLYSRDMEIYFEELSTQLQGFFSLNAEQAKRLTLRKEVQCESRQTCWRHPSWH